MKTRLLVLLFLLSGVCVQLNAQTSPNRVLPLGDEQEYRLLNYLSVMQGRSLPSQARPFSRREFAAWLGSLEAGVPGPSAADQVSRLGKVLREESRYTQPGGLAVDVYARFAAETYLHSNFENAEWSWDQNDRAAMFSVLINATFGTFLDIGADLDLTKDHFMSWGDGQNFTNIIWAPYQVDLTFPFRANIATGGEHWDLFFGREQLDWGPGHVGNLLLSPNQPYWEALRFATWWDGFKFSSVFISLEPWIKNANFGGVDYTGFDRYGRPVSEPVTYVIYDQTITPERFKMFLAHRFEFHPASWVQIALTEAIVYGGKYPDLRVFNPVMVYHNLYLKENANSLLTLEADWTPLPGLSFYGQLAMDQFSTPFEQEAYGLDAEPNGMGYQLGLLWAGMVGPGVLAVNLEYTITDPLLYLRQHSIVSFVSTRRVHSEAIDNFLATPNWYYDDRPLGLPWGGDVIAGNLFVEYIMADGMWFAFEHLLLFKGEQAINDPYLMGEAGWALHTPSGVALVRNRSDISAGKTWKKVFVEMLTLKMGLSMLYDINRDHVAGKSVFDCQWWLSIQAGL